MAKKKIDYRYARGISLVPAHQRASVRHDLIQLMGFSEENGIQILRECSRTRRIPFDRDVEEKMVKIFKKYGIRKEDIWGDDINAPKPHVKYKEDE